MSKNKLSLDNRIEMIANNLVKIMFTVFKVMFYGVKRVPVKNPQLYISMGVIIYFLYKLSVSNLHLRIAHNYLPDLFSHDILSFLINIDGQIHFMTMLISTILGSLLALGYVPFREFKEYQVALNNLSLKAGENSVPILKEVIEVDSTHHKLLVLSRGIGVDKYNAKIGDMRMAFGRIIEKIEESETPGHVDIILCKKRLPKVCQYNKLTNKITRPYSFVIGDSLSGVITQEISDLPHLLIAGTTGRGKSNFFKSVLVGLIDSSPHLQMYLLDLKRGVEMKKFSAFPNVKVATNEIDSLIMLQQVKEEMNRRFEYLEQEGKEIIIPERDEMDRIVVGVDEASLLYMLKNRHSELYQTTLEAREVTDEIAKLGRAAAIHLILATQKVTSKTIDTNIQENVTGKMCFQMNTLQGSLLVLGNKKAFDLVDHPGRGIWAKGNQFIEVQTPLINSNFIHSLKKKVDLDYKKGFKRNFDKLLDESETDSNTNKVDLKEQIQRVNQDQKRDKEQTPDNR